MTLNTDSIPVYGPLGPLGPKDNYPTHQAIYGKGGLMQVGSLEARDAIPEERRLLGLQVLVADYLDLSNLGVYILEDGITNDDWVHISESIYSGSYGPQVIFSLTEPTTRSNNAALRDGDLWIHSTSYYLYAYSIVENRWILLTGAGGGGDPENPTDIGAFPGIQPTYPVNTLPIDSEAWDNGSMSLTASGCIEISLDNVTYSQGPLAIVDTDILWTRWAATGACANQATGALIEGTITNGVYLSSGSLTLDKVPQDFNFSDLIDQQTSSVSSSNLITLTGLNADTKIWAPTGTGTSRQVSINGGSWNALPSSYGSALTVPYQVGGPNIKVRHTNSASISTASTLQVRVGDADVEGRYVSTTWSTTTVSSGPSINQPSIVTPVNNAIDIAIPTTVTSSAYSGINGAGAHSVSDWQVNSGALVTSSTNNVTSLSYINTDLSAGRWTHLSGWPSGHYGGSTATNPTTPLRYEEPRTPLISPTPYFTVKHMSYSHKLNLWVAVGEKNGVARVAWYEHKFSIANLFNPSGAWTNVPVDLDNPDRKGFLAVIWDSKNQKFVALREAVGENVVYTSTDGKSFSVASTTERILLKKNIQDFGDFLFFKSTNDFIYTSTDGSTFISSAVPEPFGEYFSYFDSLTKVRGDWFTNHHTRLESGWSLSYSYSTQPYKSTDFVTWEEVPYTPNTAAFISDSNYEQNLNVFNVRAHHDAFFFKGGDNKTYYTVDGQTVLPLVLGGTTAQPYIYSIDGYYYVAAYNVPRDGIWRAPRTMIQLAIQGVNSDGFTVGQRVKVNGLPLTYGWIHAITSTSVTIRGGYGDWANAPGRTISTDVGDSGLGLIVDLVDNGANLVSYTIPSGSMSANLDYFSRVRYGDGSMKSAWSPWSKFTTGD